MKPPRRLAAYSVPMLARMGYGVDDIRIIHNIPPCAVALRLELAAKRDPKLEPIAKLARSRVRLWGGAGNRKPQQ